MIEDSNLKSKIILDQPDPSFRSSFGLIINNFSKKSFTEKLLIKILKMNILEKIKNSPKLAKLNKIKG